MNDRKAYTPANNCRIRRRASDTARRAPAEDRTKLYLLSFLLTADRAKAERCFVAGLDLAAEDNSAFRDWAHSWARRIVINNALRLVSPHPETKGQDHSSGESR
jgi:hypothetical protein